MDTRYGRVEWGPNGTRSRTKTWGQPLKWDREAADTGERRKVFCASLADVFEDFQPNDGGPKEDRLAVWRSDLFKLIDRCQHLDWLLLTKRPENIRRMWEGPNRANVWLGTSVANQRNLDEFLPRLLSARGLGPFLFLSMEPQIGRIDLARFLFPCPTVDWVIVGGESKQGHGTPRPFDLAWPHLTVQQCREASVACFVKQMGSNAVWQGKSVHFRDSHGGDWNEWSDELRVRQCPESFYPSLVPMERV